MMTETRATTIESNISSLQQAVRNLTQRQQAFEASQIEERAKTDLKFDQIMAMLELLKPDGQIGEPQDKPHVQAMEGLSPPPQNTPPLQPPLNTPPNRPIIQVPNRPLISAPTHTSHSSLLTGRNPNPRLPPTMALIVEKTTNDLTLNTAANRPLLSTSTNTIDSPRPSSLKPNVIEEVGFHPKWAGPLEKTPPDKRPIHIMSLELNTVLVKQTHEFRVECLSLSVNGVLEKKNVRLDLETKVMAMVVGDRVGEMLKCGVRLMDAIAMGNVAYRVELPEKSRIHNLFHVSILERCKESPPFDQVSWLDILLNDADLEDKVSFNEGTNDTFGPELHHVEGIINGPHTPEPSNKYPAEEYPSTDRISKRAGNDTRQHMKGKRITE